MSLRSNGNARSQLAAEFLHRSRRSVISLNEILVILGENDFTVSQRLRENCCARFHLAVSDRECVVNVFWNKRISLETAVSLDIILIIQTRLKTCVLAGGGWEYV